MSGRAHALTATLLLLGGLLLTGAPAPAQETTSIMGRIFDSQSREAVTDMSVELLASGRRTGTDSQGIFRFVDVPVRDRLVLEFQHVAYGTQVDTVEIAGRENTMLRISLGKEAIAMEPLTVEVLSENQQRLRRAGTSLSIISEEEIEEMASRVRGVEGILDREVPGIRVSNRSSIGGVNVCVEFRGVTKSLQDVDSPCKYPLVVVDGQRMDDGMKIEALISTLDPRDIHQIEMIPPAEAGVQYGTNSLYGVLVIETKLRMANRQRRQQNAVPRSLRPPDTYNWAVEPEGHPFYRTLAATALGNAAGLALGIWAADQCIDFDRLHMDFFNSSCDGMGTAGSRIAALTLPLIGSTLGAQLAGSTRLSEGRWTSTAAMGAMMLVPGYILAGTGFGQSGSKIQVAGQVMLAAGVPLVTTFANRVFREIRSPDEEP